MTENTVTGMVTKVQRMSIHDGPGIRTTLFLKGCNFRCRWCHNPETWRREAQLERIAERCIACGACVPVCRTGGLASGRGRHRHRPGTLRCLRGCAPRSALRGDAPCGTGGFGGRTDAGTAARRALFRGVGRRGHPLRGRTAAPARLCPRSAVALPGRGDPDGRRDEPSPCLRS